MLWGDMSKLLNVLALLILGGLVGVVGWWTNHYRDTLMEHERGIAEREVRIAGRAADLEGQAEGLREAETEVRLVNEANEELELGTASCDWTTVSPGSRSWTKRRRAMAW